MYKNSKSLRYKAEILRSKGVSLNDISRQLKAPKSTISLWCRKIVLSDDQKAMLKKKQHTESTAALQTYVQKLKKEKVDRHLFHRELGKTDVGEISSRDKFVLGLALYWGEGYKKGQGEVGFTNSDPLIINVILKWFEESYGIKKEDFIARLSINKLHEKRADEVLKYWSQVTKLPLFQFTKTSLIQSNPKKVYTNMDKHFGTLRIKVRRGTNLKERILGSLEALGKQES